MEIFTKKEIKPEANQSDLSMQLRNIRKIIEALNVWIPICYHNGDFDFAKKFTEELTQKLSEFPNNLISPENLRLLQNWDFEKQDPITLDYLSSRIAQQIQIFLRNLN